MSWSSDINNALEYIETHLNIKISIKEVSKAAACSIYNFQRLFSFITGYSFSYYVRLRIMSEATKDILNRNESIIDIALKYGYNSPTSFSRAYKLIEGITPEEARKEGKELKTFVPLTFNLQMKGCNVMKFRLEKEEGFILHGVSKRFSNKDGTNFIEIPKMWDDSYKNKEIEKLCKSTTEPALFGVCYDFDSNCVNFKYMIGVRGKSNTYENLEIKPQLYAKFSCLGVKELQETTKEIFSSWLPSSKYRHADSPELEYYPPHNLNDTMWPVEIWIPVIEK